MKLILSSFFNDLKPLNERGGEEINPLLLAASSRNGAPISAEDYLQERLREIQLV